MLAPSTSEIGQIAFVVSDVAAAKRFFVEALGLSHLFDAGPNLSFIAAGSTRLMLTPPQGHGQVGANSILYFKVPSVDAAFRAATARGAVAEREPQLATKMPDHELWIGFVRDGDRNLIGLMEERR